MHELSSLDENLLRSTLVDGCVVRLRVHRLDLTVLSDDSVALRSVLAKDGGALEEQVELLGELAVWVTEEADAALAAGIEGLGPGAHH